jgi:hypothetical protein
MICKECRQKISLYLDNQLLGEEKEEFELHIQECSECRNELEKIKNIVSELNAIPLEELPEGYCKKLHKRLTVLEAEKKKRKIGNWHWKKYSLVAAALILILIVPFALKMQMPLTKQSNEMAQDYEYGVSDENTSMDRGKTDIVVTGMAPSYDGLADEQEKSESNEGYRERELKVVKTGYLSIETETYESFVDLIKVRVAALGGYVESIETYTNNYSYYDYEKNQQIDLKNGTMTIRIPQESFEEAYHFITENGEIINERTNEADLTKYYYDTENKLKNLEVQEIRLRELLSKAENVPEILQIESELTRIRTQIDQYLMDLSDIDYRASMSTIYLEMREVESKSKIKPVDNDLWTRARERFTQSINIMIKFLENFVVALFGAVPVLIVIGVVLFIGFVILRRIIKRVKK